MNKDWVLTEEQFNRLLDWLDADREIAASRYASIQLRLVRFFAARGCIDAENLADKCINIVTAKLAELADYVGDQALYFLAVARYVHLENDRENRRVLQPPIIPDPEPDPDLDNCLEACLAELRSDDRLLVLNYEGGEKQARIQNRRQIARDLGISINALRIKIHRLHQQLRECIERCLGELPAH